MMDKATAIKMFGCSMEELDYMEKNNIYISMHGEGLGSIWLACSILSDAQEVMQVVTPSVPDSLSTKPSTYCLT